MTRAPLQAVPHSEDSAVASAFVQQRIAFFGKVIFVFGLVYLVMGVILYFWLHQEFFVPGRESHIAAVVIAFAVFMIGRQSKVLGPMALRMLDVLGTLGLCLCMISMGYRFAIQLGPVGVHANWGVFAGLLSVFHVVLARAILVPSSPLRTLVICVLAFAALLVSHGMIAGWLGVISSTFSALTVTMLATVASRVIYGLHRDVREARQLGQYTLEEKIGEGGMGEVYRARHAMLRRPTAIKLLGGDVTERELHRFEKEVQLTAELTHPNTISIYDYGRTPDGTFYYAMELLDGVTLQTLVDRDGPQPPARVIHILSQVCGALREAHDAGLIHRDIKPDNVFLCRQGGVPDVVKVLDFGLVKQVKSDASASQSNVNVMVGTPLYMSPEAIAAPDAVDEKSDLYALGAVGYFLLSGTPVFEGDSVVEVCSHHLHTEPEPISSRASREIPSDLEKVVCECLAKEPIGRPKSARALCDKLAECTDAGGWTELDAEKWWAAHAERPLPAHKPSPRTLQIALDGRLHDSVVEGVST